MGANATTFVPSYTSGEVLTAANLSVTNSGVPVFATTVTRDAAFGGTGEKTLAEGQFAYIEATNTTQYYDGAAWQSVGASGITLISTTTATSGSSVAVTNCFSSTYDTYRVLITNMKGSSSAALQLQLGATATGYYWGQVNVGYSSGSVGGAGGSNDSKFVIGQVDTVNLGGSVIDIINPNIAADTGLQANGFDARSVAGMMINQGWLDNTTQYTGFTVLASSGSFSSITIRVYGYANS
jgi:hypothetical protein